MNKIILIGHVGKDPEIKEFETGSITKFSIATTEKFKANGETKSQTTWHNIVMSGKVADIAFKYVTKGSQLLVEGKQINRSYESNGETKYISEVRVFSMEFLGGNKESNDKQESTQTFHGNDIKEEPDDLPF